AHGTPSGIDASVIAWGKPILFEKGKPPEALRIAAPLRFALGVLPRTGTTASLVAGVRRLKEERPSGFAETGEAIRDAVLEGRASLKSGPLVRHVRGDDGVCRREDRTLAGVVSRNRSALLEFGVSTPTVEAACDAAIGAGALAAKLSGAGGGGAVIALLGP